MELQFNQILKVDIIFIYYHNIVKAIVKYVKEHINEVFTSDSDPIQDMNIGLPTLFKNLKSGDILKLKKDIKILGSNNYFFKKDSYLKIDNVVEYIIDEEKIRFNFSYKDNLEKEWIRVYTPWRLSYKWFKEYFTIEELSESLNEKFTDESDPIHDLGIGIFHEHNFKNFSQVAKFMVKIIPEILKKNKIPDDIILLTKYKQGAFKWEYFYPIQNYCNKYVKIDNSKIELTYHIVGEMHAILLKKGYPKVILEENPKSSENVNEKFTDESDPIKDMGIGTITWDNIKPGDIIRAIEEGAGHGYGVVFSVQSRKHAVRLIAIFFGNSRTNTEFLRIRQLCKIKEKKERKNYYRKYVTLITMSRARIDKAYRIIQPRELNSFVNEKFTDDDSDPIRDMGIGLCAHRNFNNEDEITNWLIKCLPIILKTRGIPKDIIKIGGSCFRWEYFNLIQEYVKQYISFDGGKVDINWWSPLEEKLKNKGFKKR